MTLLESPALTHCVTCDLDLDREAILDLLSLATQLKLDRLHGTETPRLTGRRIALLFDRPCARTRAAFEIAARDQGAQTSYFGPDTSLLGSRESVTDLARSLGRMYDGIAYRGLAQDTVRGLAEHSGVPVWNAETLDWNPAQALTDVLTMSEYGGGALADIAYCFTGDGRSNTARSLLTIGAILGMDVRIAAPRHLRTDPDVVRTAHELAAASGARITLTEDVRVGVAGADFVHTDTWLAMDEPERTWNVRVPSLVHFRVTRQLMAATDRPGTRFMHRLPAVHDTSTELGARLYRRFGIEGAEVTGEVFESPASIVFEQSANRTHLVKALLVSALGA